MNIGYTGMNPLIIYHKKCFDGFVAAMVALRKFPDGEIVEGVYGEEPPIEQARGRHAMLVDLTFKREPMERLRAAAKTLTVFDHHKTAMDELEGFPGCTFDIGRSGAGLTWDKLFQGRRRPSIVNYVEDYDLWRFSLPDSREINAAIQTLPFEIDYFEAMAEEIDRDPARVADIGAAVLRYQAHVAASIIKRAVEVRMFGERVLTAECPRLLRDQVGEKLAEGRAFSATFRLNEKGGRKYSLRSNKFGLDVSALARSMGGGGHRESAGFETGAQAWRKALRWIGDRFHAFANGL